MKYFNRSCRILHSLRYMISVDQKTSEKVYNIFSTSVRTSVDSDYSEVYGSNSLKLYAKIRYGLRIMHVKYIFDIIQNGGVAAILDVNTLGAITRTTPTGFLSNLVQRENLGWPTCMPIYFLLNFKNGDMAAIFVFWPLW